MAWRFSVEAGYFFSTFSVCDRHMRCSNAGTGGAVAQGGRWHEGAVQKQGEGPLELLAVLVIIIIILFRL